MQVMIRKISDEFVYKGIISRSDQAIFTYGLNLSILMLLNVSTIIVLGIAFKMLINSTVFLVSFILVRSYSGGFHASGPKRCYIYSIFLLMITFYIMKFTQSYHSIWLIALVAAFIIIFRLAPVEAKNKALSITEKKAFGQKTKIILIALMTISMLCYLFDWNCIFISITSGLVSDSVLLVIGKTVQKYYKKSIWIYLLNIWILRKIKSV